MFKILSVAVIALFSVSAKAEVKPIGTFVPTLCSEVAKKPATIVAVDNVCYGRFEGMNKSGIRLFINTGETRTFDITTDKSLDRSVMGRLVVKFNGQDKKHDQISGVIVKTSGITLSYEIQLATESNLSFQGNLQPARVTQ